MDKKQPTLKAKKDKFTQGCVSIFKKWAAFRMALDDNPKILTYYNEDQTVLEINEMLDTLYDELYSILSSNKYTGNTLENELADCLAGFIEDYFQIVLADESDIEISTILIRLYNELLNGKEDELNHLKTNESKNVVKYSIEFPILGNQKIIFEKEDEEDEEDDKSHSMKDEDGFIEVAKIAFK